MVFCRNYSCGCGCNICRFVDSGTNRHAQGRVPQIVFKIANLTEQTIDPAEWGKNFPRQYDGYKRTTEYTGTKYGGGGSEALATDKLAQDPQLNRPSGANYSCAS
jgi:hypothetical protein